MRTRNLVIVAALALMLGAGMMFLAGRSHSDATTSVHELAQQTHFHGLAVDATDPERLYLATHHGLWAVEADGAARRISTTTDDFMGFTPHPADPSVLYASGHPAGGGNLGFIASEDGGESWTQLAEGLGGPVDFHQMDVSPADPKTIYGAYAGQLQVSRDGGREWEVVGPAPEGLIDLAASSRDPGTLYAATEGGLLKSEDGGRSWQDAYWLRQPATMVHVTPDGAAYAFLVGTGLIRTSEPNLGCSLSAMISARNTCCISRSIRLTRAAFTRFHCILKASARPFSPAATAARPGPLSASGRTEPSFGKRPRPNTRASAGRDGARGTLPGPTSSPGLGLQPDQNLAAG